MSEPARAGGCAAPSMHCQRDSPAQKSPHACPLRAVHAGDGAPHDFLSRFFAPWLGIPEDPVTGSAHSVLAPYWARRLGRKQLRARQCSQRGGELRLAVDEGRGRVEIAGQAVIVLKGRLLLPAAET